MFRRQYIHSVQIGTYACPDIQDEPTKLVVTFQLIIILLPVQFGLNRFQTGSDYLRNLRTENQTEQRNERTRTEQNRTFGSVLSVLVLWISSELNFGNTSTMMDLFVGFDHWALADESRDLTTFQAPLGTF